MSTTTVNISATQVKELRDKTGAPMMDCKQALTEAKGDLEQAVVLLRKKGISVAGKKASRVTKEGAVASYIHAGGKIGVLVEVNCESDFVARTEDFKELVHDIAMHIAASDPKFVRKEDVTAEAFEREKDIYRAQAAATGKPPQVVEKIVEGKMSKFYEEVCLLEQPFIRDQTVSIGQLVATKIGKLGENIAVRRFARFKVGEVGATIAVTKPETEEPNKEFRVASFGAPFLMYSRAEGIGRLVTAAGSRRYKTMMPTPVFKRILLKLSGEALAANQGFGVDPLRIHEIAAELADVHSLGIQIAIVVGGGNFFRGVAEQAREMDRVSADHMGMLATVINALALQDALEKQGIHTRVQSAIEMNQVAEPFIRRRAIRHLEKDRVVIFAGGTGNPYFSTDTAASLRAMEIKADAILKATKVDGIYDADPMLVKDAKKFAEISYMEVLKRGLKVMDSTAISLCKDNNLPIIIFNLNQRGNIRKVVIGEKIGSLVSA